MLCKLKGTPVPVVADHVVVPQGVKDQNKTVMLAADMFFLDGIAFLVTILLNIKFVTVEHLPTGMAGALAKHVGCVIDVIKEGGPFFWMASSRKLRLFYPI